MKLYTNFVNFADLSALALPNVLREDYTKRRNFYCTSLARSGTRQFCAALASRNITEFR